MSCFVISFPVHSLSDNSTLNVSKLRADGIIKITVCQRLKFFFGKKENLIRKREDDDN